MQLERGRSNGFGEAFKQSALAPAKKQYEIQTEAVLNNFSIAIVKFASPQQMSCENLGKAPVFKPNGLRLQPHRQKAMAGRTMLAF